MPPSSTLADICGKENAQYVLELNRLIIKKDNLNDFKSICVKINKYVKKTRKIIVSFARPKYES